MEIIIKNSLYNAVFYNKPVVHGQELVDGILIAHLCEDQCFLKIFHLYPPSNILEAF